jgi:sulfotransferase
MTRRIHFISGLPRSGSTLLIALLRQNPGIAADISSPVAQMVATMQRTLSAKSEFHPMISDSKRQAVLRGLVCNYFDDVSAHKLVFDSNRIWCSKFATLLKLFPSARLICCVRPLSWIFDSFERIIHSNPLELSRMFNFDTTSNVYGRVDALNHPQTGSVGLAYRGLREAFYGEFHDRLILITYESLARQPAATLNALYEWLGEPPFHHDFHNVKFESAEFDSRMGMPELHHVHPTVSFIERETILPPDLFSRFTNTDFWRGTEKITTRVRVI